MPNSTVPKYAELKYQHSQVQIQGSEYIPEINLDELRAALKEMKNNKTPGDDGVTIESIKKAEMPYMMIFSPLIRCGFPTVNRFVLCAIS